MGAVSGRSPALELQLLLGHSCSWGCPGSPAHVLGVGQCFHRCFADCFQFLCVCIFFFLLLYLFSLPPRQFHSLLDFAGIHSIFREISDFKLSDFEGEAPWVTASLPPGTENLLKLCGSCFCEFLLCKRYRKNTFLCILKMTCKCQRFFFPCNFIAFWF